MKRIGIFGGTFDPVHNGHLAMAQIAHEKLSLDQVIFVPSYLPPHKSSPNLAPAAQRLRMVRLAIRGNPHFRVSDFEVKKAGRSYTIDTLHHFKKKLKNSKLLFILGGDAYEILEKWKDIDDVRKVVEFAVVNRPGFMRTQGKIKCHHVVMPGTSISSSYVRQRLTEGKEVQYWVPKAVAEHIKINNLYR